MTVPSEEERQVVERERRLRRLGRQIQVAREGRLSQGDLGLRLGPILNREIPQTTISRWEKGDVDLGVEQVRALEIVLGKPRGALLAAAGYVEFERPLEEDIRSIIMTDPSLHPSQRQAVLTIYQTFVETSRRLFDQDSELDS